MALANPVDTFLEWQSPDLLESAEKAYAKASLAGVWPSEREQVGSAFKAIGAVRGHRFTPKGVLGVGGAGIVLRLGDRHFPRRDVALKFSRPMPERAVEIQGLIRKEIQQLSHLRHPSIVRIVDYGDALDAGKGDAIPFYLMDFIDGLSSAKFIKRNPPTEETLLQLLRSTAEAIDYLHQYPGGPIAHLDIKPDNFVLDEAGLPTMIDLGTCKLVAQDEEVTTIACTRPYAHPGLSRLLAQDPTDLNRSRGQLRRMDINPKWDLWAYAMTSLEWLGFDRQTGELSAQPPVHALGSYSRKYVLLLLARLLSDDGGPAWLREEIGLSLRFVRSIAIDKASAVVDCLRRLDGSRNVLLQVPELSTSRKTVQAAPQTHVAITPDLVSVLEHRLFRRLNAITQLGLVSQVFPGAKHSRREHSLGTYANAIEILKVLYEDPVCPLVRQIIEEDDVRDLLLASLLHDVGHFPLAHDLEEIDSDVFSHASVGEAMLRGAWDKKKRGASRIAFEDLGPVFEQWRSSADRVVGLLRAKANDVDVPPKLKLLRSILSGPIDADKLDYLSRDARALDLPYPLGVDRERLLRCLTVVVLGQLGGATDVPVLGVHAKGKVAAEFLCMARYAMFSQAYWHHAVRAQKAMLYRAVEALLAFQDTEEKLNRFQTRFIRFVASLPESLYQAETVARGLFDDEVPATRRAEVSVAGLGTDLAPTDAAVVSWFLKEARAAGIPEAELLESILRRFLVKRLWVVGREVDQDRWAVLKKKWDSLTKRERATKAFDFEKAIARRVASAPDIPVTQLSAADAKERIKSLVAGRSPWLFIDIPGPRPGSEIGLYYVVEGQRRHLRKDNRTVGGTEQSEVWKRYSGQLVEVAGKIRVFCDPSLVDHVESVVSANSGLQDLEAVLSQ